MNKDRIDNAESFQSVHSMEVGIKDISNPNVLLQLFAVQEEKDGLMKIEICLKFYEFSKGVVE
jgi:hypothetical protein